MTYTRDEHGSLKVRISPHFDTPARSDAGMAALGAYVYKIKHLRGIERSFEDVAHVLSEDPTGRIAYGTQRTLEAAELERYYHAALARTVPPKASAHTEARERNTKPLSAMHAEALGQLAAQAKTLATKERKATLGELAQGAYEEGYTWKETAAALGLAIDTTKKYAAAHAAAYGQVRAEVSERDAAVYAMRLRTLQDDSEMMEQIAHYAMVRARRAAKGMGMPGCNEDLPTPGTGAGQGDMEENPWHTT